MCLFDLCVNWAQHFGDPGELNAASPLSALDVTSTLIVALFNQVLESRKESLQRVLNGLVVSKRDEAQLYNEVCKTLFQYSSDLLASYSPNIQDWIVSTIERDPTMCANVLRWSAYLFTRSRNLFQSLMMMLRKYHSNSNIDGRKYAVEVYCAWLKLSIHFDEKQEEEIFSALAGLATTSLTILNHVASNLLDILDDSENNASLRHSVHAGIAVFVQHQLSLHFFDGDDDRCLHNDDHSESSSAGIGTYLKLREPIRVFPLDIFHQEFRIIATTLYTLARTMTKLCHVARSHREKETLRMTLGSFSEFDHWLLRLCRKPNDMIDWVCTTSITDEDASRQSNLLKRKSLSLVAFGCFARGIIASALVVSAIEVAMLGGANSPPLPEVWRNLDLLLCMGKLCTKVAEPLFPESQDDIMVKLLLSRSSPFFIQSVSRKLVMSYYEYDLAPLSYDGLIALLDCCILSKSVSLFEANAKEDFYRDLLALYQVFSARVHGKKDAICLTNHIDTIVASMPKSHRHLVELPHETRSALDQKLSPEPLLRVVNAITRELEAGAPSRPILLKCMQKSLQCSTEGELAARLMEDLQCLMEDKCLEKLRLPTVHAVLSLLGELSSNHLTRKTENACVFSKVSDTAYDIICENVITHPALLRALLQISIQVGDTAAAREKLLSVFSALQLPTQEKNVVQKRTRKRLRRRNDSEEDLSKVVGTSCREPHIYTPEMREAALAAIIQATERTLLDYKVDNTAHFNILVGMQDVVFKVAFKNSHPCDELIANNFWRILRLINANIRALRLCLVRLKKMKSDDVTSVGHFLKMSLCCRDWMYTARNELDDESASARVAKLIWKLESALLDGVSHLEFLKKKEVKQPSAELDGVNELLHEILSKQDVTFNIRESNRAIRKGMVPKVRQRKRRLRSRHPYIDECLRDEDGNDNFLDLESFIA